MGACFLYGNGGGGSNGLQFVSGSTEPANPSEGLIWVESSLAGKKCVVSISEPESPEEGLVWIRLVANVSSYSGVTNIVSCFVYADGTWEPSNVKIFSDNAWSIMIWDRVFYPLTSLSTQVIGDFKPASNNTTFKNTGTYLTDSITVTQKTNGTSASMTNSYVMTKSTIDVSDFKKLNIIASVELPDNTIYSDTLYINTGSLYVSLVYNVNAAASARISVTAEKSAANGTVCPEGKQTYSADISSLSGNFYIKLDRAASPKYATTTFTYKIYKIWFE